MTFDDFKACPIFNTSLSTEWWRRLCPQEWSAFALMGLHDRVLDVIVPFGEPRWEAARQGDAASAVGVVLAWDRGDIPPALSDAIASVLIVPALSGDLAAVTLLVARLRRRTKSDPGAARALRGWSAFLGHLTAAKRRRGGSPST